MSSEEHSGWGEYQKLVLAELERHNQWLVKIDEKLNGTLLTFKLEKQMIEHLANVVSSLDKRVHDLETEQVESEAVEGYREKSKVDRRWIMGLSITTIMSVAALVVEVIVKT